IYAAILHTANISLWQSCLQLSVVNTLARIVSKDVPEDFLYHDIPAPWLSIRLLQILQLFRINFSVDGGEAE
ncbi:adaptin n terminal region domain-containing protein, partial [Cystoisospora suis]